MAASNEREFIPLGIAVLTITDTRTEETDKSGKLLVDRLESTGHVKREKVIVPDDVYQIRAVVSRWIATQGRTGRSDHRWDRRNRPGRYA